MCSRAWLLGGGGGGGWILKCPVKNNITKSIGFMGVLWVSFWIYFVGIFSGSILMWKKEHILSNISYVFFFERKYQIVTWGGKHMFCCLGDCRSGTTMFHIRSWCHSRQIKTG